MRYDFRPSCMCPFACADASSRSQRHMTASSIWQTTLDRFRTLLGPPTMTAMQLGMSKEFRGWPIYAQMLGATSFQITLLSGQNYQGDLQLYVLFFVASLVWCTLFRLKRRATFSHTMGLIRPGVYPRPGPVYMTRSSLWWATFVSIARSSCVSG